MHFIDKTDKRLQQIKTVVQIVYCLEITNIDSCICGLSTCIFINSFPLLSLSLSLSHVVHKHIYAFIEEKEGEREREALQRIVHKSNSSHSGRCLSVMALRNLMSHVLCASFRPTIYSKKCQPGVWTQFYNRNRFSIAAAMATKYKSVEKGVPNSTSYRVFISEYTSSAYIYTYSYMYIKFIYI